MMLPPLDDRGLLPEGIHSGTWHEIDTSFGTTKQRQQLIGNAKAFSHDELVPLHPAPLFLAGSTFSDKPNPSDIEATIRVNPDELTDEQIRLQRSHDRIKAAGAVDFYVTLAAPNYPDFTQFFQYVGSKTAAMKGLADKDKRGVVEVDAWNLP